MFNGLFIGMFGPHRCGHLCRTGADTLSAFLRTWIQRGYVPGLSVETSGKRRNFDIQTAVHIGIMADLMQYGIGAAIASLVAQSARMETAREDANCLLFAKSYSPSIGKQNFQHFGVFNFVAFKSEKHLFEALEKIKDDLPSSYFIVNVARITDKMLMAEKGNVSAKF